LTGRRLRKHVECMMKIAVPARGGLVDEHFGHCKEFLVFSAGQGALRVLSSHGIGVVHVAEHRQGHECSH
jgi:predicted Fe-Mo cluster-binding NifX family protein